MEQKKETAVQLRECEAARLHQATLLPGGRTENVLDHAKFPKGKFFWMRGEGLLVNIDGKEGLIPAAAVSIVFFNGVK